jgi:hypothetical protein
MTIKQLKPGDVVTRWLAGVVPMRLTVTAIDDRFIHCGDWKFDRRNGAEVDEELGWSAEGSTGSYIKVDDT